MMTTTTTATSPRPSPSSTILSALGSGSGIDIGALTGSLVEAQFAVKTDALRAKTETLTAQISGVASLKSGITGFAAALTTLATGGSLQTQPTSSNAAAVTATAMPGAKLKGLAASVTVTRLAAAQVATTASLGARTRVLGPGNIAIQLGTATTSGTSMTGFTGNGSATVNVAIARTDTLDDIATKINAADAGVTATVVVDINNTARLSFKGQTGQANGFRMTITEGNPRGLAALKVGTGGGSAAINTVAANAQLSVDGVTVQRASNTVTDLIAGVKLELLTTTTAPVTLGGTTPTANISQAVNDFVAAYNDMIGQVKEQTNPITGALRGDAGAQNLLRGLRALTLTPLVGGAAAGAPTTLAGIGVTTNRDGTLAVDAARLSTAMTANPAAIEAMFAPGTGSSGAGLPAALNAVAFNAGSTLFGLGASTTRYSAQQSKIAAQQAKLEDQSAAMQTRLTKQFAGMDARVAAYKSTQTFLENQIKAWNSQD